MNREQVFQIKYLGIIIYCKLSWKKMLKTYKKNTTSCCLISKIRHHVDQTRKLYVNPIMSMFIRICNMLYWPVEEPK